MREVIGHMMATVLVVGIAACHNSGNQADPPAALSVRDSAGIVAADSAFQAAMKAGNAAQAAAVYASDASLLPPNQPLRRGRTAIQAFWGGLLDAYTLQLESASDVIEGRGDVAYNMGHYRFTALPKEKSSPGIAEEGKFVVILKKQPDGSWKYIVDIYNSNLAPQH